MIDEKYVNTDKLTNYTKYYCKRCNQYIRTDKTKKPDIITPFCYHCKSTDIWTDKETYNLIKERKKSNVKN